MPQFLYRFIRLCDTPPKDNFFWNVLHSAFVIFSSCYGRLVLKKIKKENPGKNVAVLVSSSMGDVLFLLKYYDYYLKSYGYDPDETILLIGESLKRVTSVFGFKHVMYVSQVSIHSVMIYNILKDDLILPIQPYAFFNEQYKGWADEKAIFDSIQGMKSDFRETENNVVVLSPYEKSLTFLEIEKLSEIFWQDLATALKAKGFLVKTNCANTEDEPPIKNTVPVFPKYSEIVNYCDSCCAIVGMRSGFMDFASLSKNSKIYALYPDQLWLEKFNLKRLWGVKECREKIYSDMTEEELINDIVDFVEKVYKGV